MQISQLEFNDESMGLIVRGLALECHEFAASRGILSHSVEHQLGLVLGVICNHSSDLLDFRDVFASDAPCIASVHIGFSDKGYRLLAEAAKNVVANAVYADSGVIN